MTLLIPWGTPVERERRARIHVSVLAYAYEYHAHSIVPDSIYDQLARAVCPTVTTGHAALDQFFRTTYSPDTGMWIRSHPELSGIINIYDRYYSHVQRPSHRQHVPLVLLPVLHGGLPRNR